MARLAFERDHQAFRIKRPERGRITTASMAAAVRASS
jgi:hypothetical protein